MEPDNVRPLRPERIRRWNLRARVRADFSRVGTPAVTLWPRSVAGLLAGVWACAMSLLLFLFMVVLSWVLAPMGSGQFGDVVRAAASIWLLANGGSLEWQGASISLPPLVLTLALVLFMRRAGSWLADAVDAQDAASAKQSYLFAIAAACSVQLLVAASAQNDDVRISIGRSLLGAVVVGAIGFGWGLGRVLGIELPEAWYIHRVSVQRYVIALTSSATVLTIVSAAWHRQGFVDVLRAVAGDVTSIVQLLLICVVFLPTLILWFVAVLLGPGFAFGAGTHIGLQAVEIGALPPVPLLALIPNNPPTWALALFVVPFAAALWAIQPVPREENGMLHARSVAELLLLGMLTGGVLGLLGSGGMGPGRLTQIGPVLWQAALAGAGWLALACVADEVIRRIRLATRT